MRAPSSSGGARRRPYWGRMWLVAGATLLLSGCGALCTGFDRRAADHMTPGVTTLAEATERMGEMPASVYRQLDGSLTARWARHVSVLTDAVYCHRELWLAFGPDGTFQRVVKGPEAPPRADDGSRVSDP